MLRAKTRRVKHSAPTSSLTGEGEIVEGAAAVAMSTISSGDMFANGTEKSLDVFFAQESQASLHRPWLRLESSNRVDRIRDFVTRYEPASTQVDKDKLLLVLISALTRKLLQSKNQVVYNESLAQIDEIRGITMKETAAGKAWMFAQQRPTKRKSRIATLGSTL